MRSSIQILAFSGLSAAAIGAVAMVHSTGKSGLSPAACQPGLPHREAQPQAGELHTLSGLAWFTMDSTGSLVDYAFAEPGDTPATCLTPAPSGSERSLGLPTLDTTDQPEVELVESRAATTVGATLQTLSNVKWWRVDENDYITEYASYAPSPTPWNCVAKVTFTEDAEGNWVWNSADCLNPCTTACFFCFLDEGNVTRWWCACAEDDDCSSIPN